MLSKIEGNYDPNKSLLITVMIASNQSFVYPRDESQS